MKDLSVFFQNSHERYKSISRFTFKMLRSLKEGSRQFHVIKLEKMLTKAKILKHETKEGIMEIITSNSSVYVCMYVCNIDQW